MAGDKKSVASLTLLADQPKQALDDLLAAETRVTEQGGKLATSFATGFESIEDRAKKALAAIANGGNAESQLNRLVAEFVKLKTAEEAAEATGQTLPEEFTKGFAIAEQQIIGVTAAMQQQREQVTELKARFIEAGAAATDATKGVADGAAGASTALEAVGTSGEQAGVGVTTGAESGTTALEAVVGAAEQAATSVDQIAAASERAALPLPDVRRGFVSVADAAKNMADSVDRGWTRDEEGARESARTLAEVLQNRIRLKEAIVDEFGAMENADTETRAAYEAWDVEVQRLTLHVQEMVAAQRQAAVATKEGGEQFATIGLLAEQAGRHFGETGEKIGSAAGQLGLMAAMSAHLKKSFESLNLNEFGSGWARIAIQAGAVVAVFAASVAGGLKMAEANEQNAESVEHLKAKLTDWLSVDLLPWFGRMEAGMQVFLADLVSAGTATTEFFEAIAKGDADGAKAAIDRVKHAFDGLENEVDAAGRAQDRRTASTHAAATADEIAAKFAEQNAEMNKRVAAAIEVARGAVEKRTGSQEHLTTAVKAGAEADADAARKAADDAEEVAKAAEKIAKGKEVEAKNARQVVEALKESAKAHEDDSEKTKTDIESASKLAKAKEGEATAAKLAADALKEAAAQAKEDAKEADEAAKASEHLAEMLQSLTDAVNQETGAYAKKESAVQRQIDKLREELKTNGDLTASDRARITEMISVASSIDSLQREQDKLTGSKKKDAAASDEQTSAIHRHSEALKSNEQALEREIERTGSLYIAQHKLAESESQITVVKSGRAAQVEADIELQRRLLNSINDETKATDAASVATSKNAITQDEATGAISNVAKATGDAGKAAGESSVHYDAATRTMTNVKSAADGVADATKKAGSAAEDSDPFWQQFNEYMAKAGITIVPQFSAAMSTTGEAIGRVNPELSAHVLEMDKLNVAYAGVSNGLGSIGDNLGPLVEHLKEAKSHADELVQSLGNVATAVHNIPSGDATDAGS